jgi:uncharacterized membrane protein
VLFAVSRGSLLLLSDVSLRLWPALFKYPERRQVFLEGIPMLDGLCRWDCGLYERIAREGYHHHLDANIWPLFPALSRLLSELTCLPLHFALLLVATLASLASFVVIYRLFVELAGEPAARWGLLAWTVYPFAFFQGVGYPESLMTLLGASAILVSLRGRPVWAAVLLGVGLLARHLTAIAGLALLVRHVRERGLSVRALLLSPAAIALLIPLCFLGGWCLFLALVLGEPWAFLSARRAGWGEQAWWGVFDVIAGGHLDTKYVIYFLTSLIPGIGAFALLRDRRHWELAVFAVPLMLVLWLVGAEALGRYSAACWPAFLPVGVVLARRPELAAVLVAVSGVFQGVFAFLFVHQFPFV